MKYYRVKLHNTYINGGNIYLWAILSRLYLFIFSCLYNLWEFTEGLSSLTRMLLELCMNIPNTQIITHISYFRLIFAFKWLILHLELWPFYESVYRCLSIFMLLTHIICLNKFFINDQKLELSRKWNKFWVCFRATFLLISANEMWNALPIFRFSIY